jgi:uncharacterized protein (DUF2147 family)
VTRRLALILLALGTPHAAVAAPGPEGFWRTATDNGVVQVFACGAALCGTLVTSDRLKEHPEQVDGRNADASLRTRTLKGLALFTAMKGGPTEWAGGSLYNPDDGHTYRGSIRLTGPDTLTLTGCVFKPFCRSETWTRTPPPP